MPEVSRVNIDVWKRRFRRKYASNLAGLSTLSDEIASEAGEVVTITATNMEGGSGSGVVTGNKLEMLAAVEELLSELDPSAPREPSQSFAIRFEP